MPIVEIKYEGSVAVLTMNNGENRFSPAMVSAIHAAYDEIESNESARAMVITGTGKYFSNGLDLTTLAALKPEGLKAFQPEFSRMFKRTALFPKPTIAAINGHAFAGGAMLASLADFRYMRADRGWVCLPEVDIQLPFWPGMIAMLENAFSREKFKDVAYSGRKYTSEEVLKMGFIETTYSIEELLPKCIEHAAALGAKNLKTYAEIKRRMNSEMARIIEEEDPKYYL